MSEINGPKFSINHVNFGGIQKATQDADVNRFEESSAPQINDFSDPKAEALGRSMLIKNSDDTNNDLKALLDNPQIAENSDKMFEVAYKAAQNSGIEQQYENAASFATTAMN